PGDHGLAIWAEGHGSEGSLMSQSLAEGFVSGRVPQLRGEFRRLRDDRSGVGADLGNVVCSLEHLGRPDRLRGRCIPTSGRLAPGQKRLAVRAEGRESARLKQTAYWLETSDVPQSRPANRISVVWTAQNQGLAVGAERQAPYSTLMRQRRPDRLA